MRDRHSSYASTRRNLATRAKIPRPYTAMGGSSATLASRAGNRLNRSPAPAGRQVLIQQLRSGASPPDPRRTWFRQLRIGVAIEAGVALVQLSSRVASCLSCPNRLGECLQA